MKKGPITISATTLGRAQHIPDYHQWQYLEEGDIPNHIAAELAFLRKELKPNEKIIVQDRKLYIVEKTVFDKFVDWVAGRRPEKAVRRFNILSYFQNPIPNAES